jgi:hypothetical protein
VAQAVDLLRRSFDLALKQKARGQAVVGDDPLPAAEAEIATPPAGR